MFFCSEILFSFLLISSAAVADEPTETQKTHTGEAFGFSVENDSANLGGPGSDQAYSSGFQFSYVFAQDQLPMWGLPFIKDSLILQDEIAKSQINYGFTFGQQIFTPNDTSRTDLIVDDRPYAGWMYFGMNAHIKTPTKGHFFQVSFGVVGPEAYGEKVQNEFHRMIGDSYALGWRNQLKTEPTVQVTYQQRLKFFELTKDDYKYFDLIPYFGGDAGNVLIAASAGILVRFGIHLPDDLGPTRPSAHDGDNFISTSTKSDEQRSYYVFAATRGDAVARDMFLDGNTFQASHHVKKYPFVSENELGLGTRLRHWDIIWRFVVRSPDFEQKSRFNSFASFNINYYFD